MNVVPINTEIDQGREYFSGIVEIEGESGYPEYEVEAEINRTIETVPATYLLPSETHYGKWDISIIEEVRIDEDGNRKIVENTEVRDLVTNYIEAL